MSFFDDTRKTRVIRKYAFDEKANGIEIVVDHIPFETCCEIFWDL